MSDILTGTPADLTYANEMVRHAWLVVWAITSGALVVILGWMGLSLNGRAPGPTAGGLAGDGPPPRPRPRGRRLFALVVRPSPGRGRRRFRLHRQAGSVGMAQILTLLYLVYGFFVLYLVVQMVLHLALIDILLALAPIALGLWILPHTAGWGRHWLRLFMTTVFQQGVQLIALALGLGFLNQFASIAAFEPVQDLVWKLLMSIAFVYMATRVPSMLGNHGTFDSWLHTLYFGMNLPGSMVRAARSIGLVAGGAAGGPGGIAVGAMAASAGLSAAAFRLSSAASLATPSAGGGDGGE